MGGAVLEQARFRERRLRVLHAFGHAGHQVGVIGQSLAEAGFVRLGVVDGDVGKGSARIHRQKISCHRSHGPGFSSAAPRDKDAFWSVIRAIFA